ncbi:L-arabinose transport system permease protein AraQ [Jeotgalicoccus aerolatus]|uniref:Multiple sugar transport system permease protein n=1 Tax=Jeotgalicoccus aerolatus TaxID=709510 RepID=A0ABS4HPV8_9STAP|nr:carbohydrate ABC transporter permease [Jeotgalicoccus aerolatus]MBP1952941.1 multiple sugar transport system permease protein [Jeotgalicoccus aerolatus]GGE01273.1 sugar ABC transporter permease [Jeotgalicoccus aerolatus]CAD2073185.1 L-arabinose transport system permease protein AraQ [Jeotgalicoccus aerolatus]HJG32937.1 carbohydrate ABC transporter permease [Jeotgalicoccus aerolatus]
MAQISKKTLIYILLGLGALTMIIPFYWMIATSLKTAGEATAMPPVWWPGSMQFSNYVEAFQVAPFGRYLLNSVFVTLLSTIGEVLTAILAAFAFARLNFYGKDILFALLLATMMVPGELLIIPNFVTLANLDWINTYMALIVPWLASVFSVFIVKQRFESISDNLYYAAKIDGCSDFRFLWQVLVPLSRSSIITMVVLKVIGSWNAFLWPLLVTNATEMRTLPVGLQSFTTEAGTRFELLMAASTFVIVPMIVFYMIFQKYIIKGIANTGTKG